MNVHFFSRCSKLTHLSMCFCENLTDNGFECLDNCASLVSLDITGCKIHDKVHFSITHNIYWIAKLFYSCSQYYIILKMCLSQGLAALGTNHSLRKLTATECVFITDNGIKVWFAFLSLHCAYIYDLQCICRLITLFGKVHVIITVTWWSFCLVQMFCRQCHRLELLDVCQCVCLSDRAIKALSFFCRTIATVRIAGCPKVHL